MLYFGSDNNSGAHPRIVEAVSAANSGSYSSYGEDELTGQARALFKQHFGPQAEAFFVFTGTAANVLGLKSLLASTEGIICAQSAHIHTDECGAPEAGIGCKLYTLPAENGKVKPEQCLPLLLLRESVHHSYPRVLSITQSTELGTLYSLAELRDIGAFCKQHGLYLHMDGARLCNAAAALDAPLAALSTEVGVDMLSFGGVKNGLLFGEAIVALNPELVARLPYLRKQGMQLLSKMRFISAQFIEYLKDGLWLQNADKANSMAQQLAAQLQGLPQVHITRPVEVNAVFARLPRKAIEELWKEFYFYIWDEQDEPAGQSGSMPNWPEVRWMTSFNTTQDDVRRFAEAIKKAAGRY